VELSEVSPILFELDGTVFSQVGGIHEQDPAGRDQKGRTVEQPIESEKAFCDHGTVHEQKKRVVCSPVIHVGQRPLPDIGDTPFPHDPDRLGEELQRGDAVAALLEGQSVRTHAGSDIEHSTPTTFERETLPILEFFLTPKEERDGQFLALTEVVPDRHGRTAIPSVEADQRRSERRPCTRETRAVD